MARFFVSGPLGFESQLCDELKSFWFLLSDLDGLPTRAQFPELTLAEGGVEFECEMHLGLQINYFSKIANRVLLRAEHFSARFYDQFEKQLTKIKWSSFVKNTTPINFKVSFSKSRLNNEKNLLEACTSVFTKLGYKVVEQAEQEIYIRIVKDQVEVSLDSTGEHLHFRGYRKQQGEAPIRENLAALMWSFVQDSITANDVVVDPFCGSGTLLFEYQIRNRPHFLRSYSFLNWLHTPAILKSPTFSKNFRWIEPDPKTATLFGCDINPETLKKAQANELELNRQFQVQSKIQWILSSCAQIDLAGSTARNLVIVANPPYGERLDDQGAMLDMNRLLEKNRSYFTEVSVYVLQPLGRVPEFKALKLKQKIPFSNQGLKLSLLNYNSRA